MRISIENLHQKIGDIIAQKSSQITTLYTKTKPKLKAGHPFKELVKLSKVNGIMNADYATAAKKLGKVINERPWGKRLSGSLVKHKGLNYLQIRPLKTSSVYMDGDKEVPFDQVKYYLPEFSEQIIPVRTYKLDNIVGIGQGGKIFALRKVNLKPLMETV